MSANAMARLIIDGYNLLYGSVRYAGLAERDVDAARERLIADLGAETSERDVTVVFDGASNPASDGKPHSVGGITVIFSPFGVEADSVIEALATRAREAGEPTEIVTSDHATRWASVGGPVHVTRSASFAKEIDETDGSWREAADSPRRRSTIGDRIRDDIRSRLERGAGDP